MGLTSSRKHFHQWNTILEPNPMEAHFTRDTKAQLDTPPWSRRTAPQEKRRQFNRARLDAEAPKSETAQKKSALLPTH